MATSTPRVSSGAVAGLCSTGTGSTTAGTPATRLSASQVSTLGFWSFGSFWTLDPLSSPRVIAGLFILYDMMREVVGEYVGGQGFPLPNPVSIH